MAGEAEHRQPRRGTKRKCIRRRGPDWTSLPELTVDLILDRLDSPKEYLMFMLVCKTWMRYAVPLWPYKKANYERFLAPRPMLVVADHVYSADTGEIITTSEGCFKWPKRPWPSTDPIYRRVKMIGSCFGRLIIHRPPIDGGTGFVGLVNPQANRGVGHRYRLSTPSDRQLLDGFHASKAVLSADPSSSSSYALAVLFRKPSSEVVTRLLFLRDLPSKTTDADAAYRFYQASDHVLDIAHHGNNNICVLQKETPGAVNTDPEGLVIATLSGTGDVIRRAKIAYVWDDAPFERTPLHPRVGRRISTAYLVERLPGSGRGCYNHWLVMRHRVVSELEGAVSTVGFGVFEWVHSRKDSHGSMLWRRAHGLKNEAIFLGRNSAFSVPAGSGLLATGGLAPNYIYFFDDQQLKPEKNILVMAPDIGTFDVVQDCRKLFGFPREFKHLLGYGVMKNHAPPLWFTIRPDIGT